MAVPDTIVELLDSRTYRGTPSGQTASRAFLVYHSAGSQVDRGDVVTAFLNYTDDNGHVGIEEGDVHPEHAGLSVTSPPTIVASRQKPYTFTVVWNYGTPSGGGGGPGGPDTEEAGYVELNIATAIQWVDIYRTEATLPTTNANRDHPPDTDIGGESVDGGGQPVSKAVRIQRINYTHVYENLTGSTISGWWDKVGKRNSDTVNSLGVGTSDIGKLLYVGSDSQRTPSGTWRVVHKFAFDEDYHLRQIARRYVDGRPNIAATRVTSNNTYTNVANDVRWVQPYPARVGLGSIIA